MRLPRFTPIDDRTLGRFRIQSLLIGVVWAILAGVRIATADGDPIGSVITSVIIVIALGFIAVAVLAHLEFRRRASDA